MALDPVTAALDIGGKILDKIFPDPNQRAAAQLELVKLQQNGELAILSADTEIAKGQMAINQVEAASSNIFVSGGRPFVIWVCGVAFAYHFVLQPFLAFVMASFGHKVDLPVFDMGELSTALMGLLGLGGYRTFEKVRGVS